MKKVILLLIATLILGCKSELKTEHATGYLKFSENILDYRITPKDSIDKSGLMFSDQGAWFAYSLHKTNRGLIGFSGPFLMTQDNGIWSKLSPTIHITSGDHHDRVIDQEKDLISQNGYSSHLEQLIENDKIRINIELVYLNGNTALQRFKIKNKREGNFELNTSFVGGIPNIGLKLTKENNYIKVSSGKSNVLGYVRAIGLFDDFEVSENLYYDSHKSIELKPNETKSLIVSQTFIFPEYSWEQEKVLIERVDFDSVLNARKQEKNSQLKSLIENRKPQFQENKYAEVLAKAHLTLQNNWRIPAGEIEHEGLFPSYHYKWFNGFWSWDSWKHAVGLSYYDLRLAKEQVKLMFKFQNDDGFVADCVYRDTTIEAHNYRDTKPPLSAWAVAKIYEKDKDLEFVKYMYPKLKKYHYWWYNKRDNDQDGLCEYGSTDGSLIAAKWESGMDNAIRFDDSKILKNEESAYSLDQESVDLNAYLYAEKLFLSQLAEALNLNDASQYKSEAESLKVKIQTQFYDGNDGWFYDTNLDGTQFIKGEGSEGWTALWANAATQKQAEAVKNKMMNPNKFFTKVPFQTMSADHEKFDPLKGYWRGPNWLDQAYFGVKGLRNYGFNKEADKATIQIFEGAEGLLGKGKSIRENYHPLTGEGLHAQNFSWSAAHVIMLLMNEKND
ncbi:trehalase family glycosidase [Pontimicrobium sp. SW4]|uniref:Trehalase family glycosidase n=1 Tax=Pontimicrobium sp. SW4 TaxID=3153519 RepID=A0AAU7BTH8_9FLAO